MASVFPDLSKRILKASSSSRFNNNIVTHNLSQLHLRPEHYKEWDDESMAIAIKLVEKEGKSFRKVRDMCGIPISTLHNHVSGKVDPFSKPVPKPYLSPKEEDELVVFLLKCARMGYSKSRNQVLAIVQNIVNAKDLNVEISSGWWSRFKKRHPNLTLRTSAPLSIQRLRAQDPDMLSSYFNELEKTLHEYNIFNDPNSIFNCDETGIPLNPKPVKTIYERGTRYVSAVTGQGKSQITILACVSASGYAIPPYVVFDRKTLNHELTKGEVPGTVYGLSTSGWMDTELFKEWFLQHFLKCAPSSRPLILLMDGHSSHYSLEMIKIAQREGVILFTLPPNTTHLCQPLDKGPFGPLKLEWRKSVLNFLSANPGRIVSRYDFSPLFQESWMKAMTARNITAGFRHTGICPFDKQAVLSQLGCEERQSPQPECLGLLKFMPPDVQDLSDLDISSCYLPPKSNIGRSYHISKAVSTPKVTFKKSLNTKPKQCRILTSRENIMLMEEKEMRRREKYEQIALKKKIKEDKKKKKEDSMPHSRIRGMVFQGP